MKKSLEVVVFFCGACVMVLELVGSRLLAPYLGTSLFVWTSLIGVILGCLSLGYWLGGVLADRRPQARVLSGVLLISGIFVTVIALSGDALLYLVQNTITDIRLGAVAATIVLFGVPSVLLGMVSPFSVRLKISQVEKSGSTAGQLYALSTLGSIAGTFLAGFYLLQTFSHRDVLFMIALVLIALALLMGQGKAGTLRCLLAFAAVVGASFTPPFVQRVMGQDFVEIPTAYNRVWIYDAYLDGRPVRVLQLNDTSDSAMFLNSEDLALDYTKYFRLAGHFQPDIRRALMIGGGAYSYPKFFLKEFPNASMDVVEIDPKLTQIAKDHFRLTDSPRLKIYHEDARTFLNKKHAPYDAVFTDVYKSYSIPFQLATRETMKEIHGALSENGVLAMNVISAVEGEDGRLLRALLADLDGLFPQVLVFAVDDPENGNKLQNLMVVAFKTKHKRQFYSENSEINRYLSRIWIRDIPRDVPMLTDAFAPVEKYTVRWITHHPERKKSFMQKRMNTPESN